MEALTGPLPSRWVDSGLNTPEGRALAEDTWQQEKVAFRHFSEKVVSAHCTGILKSTLDRLDNVRDSVHKNLQAKESFELLEPVLQPLTSSLKMDESFYYWVTLTEEEIEEERKRDEEEEEEKKRNPSPTPLTERQKFFEDDVKRLKSMSNDRFRSWTEEEAPQLVLKKRLRILEKTMAIFPYVLKSSPDPVRQELEQSGFVQQTRTLRQVVRSLLTCEGIPHVTVAQSRDEFGGYESDDYMDQDAARIAPLAFSTNYHARLYNHAMNSLKASMAPATETDEGLWDTTQAEDRVPVKKSGKDRQQLKVQVAEDQVLFSSPDVEFAWTWEAIVRLFKATKITISLRDPEVVALMFQE